MSKRFTKNDYFAAASSLDECGKGPWRKFCHTIDEKYNANSNLCDEMFEQSSDIEIVDLEDQYFLACQIALEKAC